MTEPRTPNPESRTPAPTVAVIIVNYRRPELTREAIMSVLASEGVEARVVLVENAGDGQWASAHDAAEPRVEVIANPDNIGFGAACNQGIERALSRGDQFIFLLNNDARVEPGTLATLIRALTPTNEESDSRHSNPESWPLNPDPSCPEPRSPSLAAPKILLPDGRLYAAGGLVELNRARCRNRGIYQPDSGRYDRPGPLEFASACALLIDRRALKGGIRFHEPYFLYYEDADFCLQMRRAGHRIVYVPQARVVHAEAGSTPAGRNHTLIYYKTRNRLFLLWRQGNLRERWAGSLYLAVALGLKALAAGVRGRWAYLGGMLRGVMDFLRGRWGPLH